MRRIGEGGEQMSGADRRRTVFQRSPHPRRFEPCPQPLGQSGLAAHLVRQAVDGGEQAIPDAVDVEFIAAHDRDQIAVAELQQLDEPVFDLDVAVGARFAKARRVGERAGAMIVETAQERGEVALGHGESEERRGKSVSPQWRTDEKRWHRTDR